MSYLKEINMTKKQLLEKYNIDYDSFLHLCTFKMPIFKPYNFLVFVVIIQHKHTKYNYIMNSK